MECKLKSRKELKQNYGNKINTLMDQQTSAQKKNKELQNFIKKEENGIHDRKQASGKVIIREYKPECEQRIKQLETELE